ncbi:hypothetical protein Tco_0600101 [Tanacetum coccineum]|uniref:Uncharacterized protein n=1 Tax=Tanacetum coccineum TaxID=301880 RepID=A0ABQ4WAU4_9ASTR
MMEICFKKLRNLVKLIYHLFPIWIIGFLKKFRGGFEQDIDKQVKKKKKKKRSGEDEESKICCGLNNREDEEIWKSMALSEKVQEVVCQNREMPA